MPYTLAHPAAALPLWRASNKRLRLAALVIGAASPDFQYFLRINASGHFSHTIPGLLLVCLPASWLALYLFDRWGRAGVQALLPSTWRLPSPPIPARRPIANISLAILLGALSHVLWDSFTHRSGWIVRLLPSLTAPLLPILFPAVPAYRLLQHGSTILGLCILIRTVWLWTRTQPEVPWSELAKRTLLCVSFLGAAGVLNGLRFLSRGVGQFLVAGGIGVMLALALGILALGWRYARIGQ